MNTGYLSIDLYCLLFFHQRLTVIQGQGFTTQVRFIPRYLILSFTIVNGIVFLISVSDSLLVCRNATDDCLLTLYTAALLNVLVLIFLVEPGIFHTQYPVICIQQQAHFFLAHVDAFISFFPVTAVARTYKTILNKSGKIGHPHPVSDLRGKAFSFLLVRWQLWACPK